MTQMTPVVESIVIHMTIKNHIAVAIMMPPVVIIQMLLLSGVS